MSLKSIYVTLALTVSISYAEKMRLAQLLNLRTEMVNDFEFGHDLA